MANGKPGRPKGMAKTGGRAKGASNKVTAQLKDMILGALDDVGGQEYLANQARENPTAFLSLIGKVLPTTLTGNVGLDVQITEIKRTIVDPKDNVIT
jgi:hypothetical protein